MYSFYIDGSDVKLFMNKLLRGDDFNSFNMVSCDVVKNVTVTIDGRVTKDWYDEKVENKFEKWENVRGYIFDIIKGKKSPKKIKLVLSLDESIIEKIHKNAKSCSLKIEFADNKVNVLTGVMQKEFSLDKSLDDNWDQSVKKFFKKLEIAQNV